MKEEKMGDAREPEPQTKMTEKRPPPCIFDDVIRERAEDEEQVPLIAYPRTKDGIDDYEFFNGKQLNNMVDGAAKALMSLGVEPVYEDTVAAIYGPSTLSYIITVFALGRLGYTTFILSPRLPVSACVSLLSNTNTTHFLYGPQYHSLATATSSELSQTNNKTLKTIPILTREQYDIPLTTPPFTRQNINPDLEKKKILILMHSSGSTGLPKPIDYRHVRLFATFRTAQKLSAFQSVPLFHAHGFISFIQSIFVRKCIFLFNGLIPQTNETVTKAIQGARLDGKVAEVVWTVPYVLKLLCEGGKDGEGVKVLKECKVVSCSGSRTPDELGDLLVSQGIPFGSVFGATEVALILTSLNRPPGDNAWNYLRPPPHIAPYILMRPIPSQSPTLPKHEIIHECIVLDGHVGKMKSNSNDPPNSYHTSDLFIPHPTIPNAWKPIGRADDRLTLLNGEKVLPLAIEGRITQHRFVKEAVMFGVDRSVPGLLFFRAKAAEGLNDEEFLDSVWEVVEDANSKAEGFSQIERNMVVVLGPEVECPVTDKSSIKRAAVYREFKDVIDAVYERLESEQEGSLILDEQEMEEWLMVKMGEMGTAMGDREADFFSMGVDSLKAIQMRALIIKTLDLGGNAGKVSSMVVYDSKNVVGLAKVLVGLRTGTSVEKDNDEIQEMEALIEQFSVFNAKAKMAEKKEEGCVVLLTGATGSLGSHILNQLVSLPHITQIICPIRSHPPQTPHSRLSSTLSSRGFPTLSSSPKIVPISLDLSTPNLNLATELGDRITHIIHCSWTVNFALPLTHFVPQLHTLQNLINLSLQTSSKLLFCSSIGTATSTPGPLATIPERPIQHLNQASPTGYARSKLVAERILERAGAANIGADVHILRIGQIIPALTENGEGSMLWNTNEMIPLMVRSALVVGCLPDIPGNEDECSWIDVETLSKGICEIAGLARNERQLKNECLIREKEEGEDRLVYNLVSPKRFSWKEEFLPRLQEAGLEFEIVDREEWLRKLKNSENDLAQNPSRKLVGFWEAQSKSLQERKLVLETKETEKRSQALREMRPVLEGDYVKRLLEAWRKVW